MAMKKSEQVVEIRPLDIRPVKLRIVGDSPLIMHAWSEKAKRMMLEAQQGKSKGKSKDAKNPVEDFINSMYWLTEKPTEYTEEAFEKAIEKGARFGFRLLDLSRRPYLRLIGWAGLKTKYLCEGRSLSRVTKTV